MGHSAFAFWFWVVGDHPSRIRLMSHHSQSRQSKQSWHVEQSLHATAPPHAPDDPDTPTHHAQWEAIAHDRASRRKQLAAQMGGEAESHTHRSSTDTLHVSARSMWPALSPRSYLAFHRSSCRSPRSQSTWRDDRPVDELTECERLGARWVEHHDSHLILGEELAQGPAVGVAVLIELHPLHGFVVKRKRPGVGAWVTC